MKEQIKKKLLETLEASSLEKEGDSFLIPITIHPYEKLIRDVAVKNILESDSPKEAFINTLAEMQTEYEDYNGRDELIALFCNTAHFTEDEEFWILDHSYDYYDIIDEIMSEHICFQYDIADMKAPYRVNLMLNTGDCNYDFACNNALNSYGNYSMKLEEPSSILWLAKQQGKDALLLSEMKRIYGNTDNGEYVEREKSSDEFVESLLQELENNSHCCTCLTFLLEMTLPELVDFKDGINKKEIKNFRIDKDATCGLFAPFVGGGSCLEIFCDKDIVVPGEYVWTIHVDGLQPAIIPYDVDNVYGLCGECWNGKLTYERGKE